MRFVTLLILALAGCAYGATDDDGGIARRLSDGLQSPAYCFSGSGGTANSCGSCSNVGERLRLLRSHARLRRRSQWRCSWAGGSSGGCPHGDGGLCNHMRETWNTPEIFCSARITVFS